MLGRVYFLEPHQDDGALFMGQVAAHHVLAGRDVHAVLMSNGSTSNVLGELNGTAADPTWWGGNHDPDAEGYATLTPETLALARTNEWSQSWRQLGVGPDRMHFGADLPSVLNLPDAVTAAYATEVIRYLSDRDVADGLPRPGFYTMWWDDPTTDHANCGMALRTLALTDPGYSQGRWLVKPEQAALAGAVAYSVPAGLLPEVKARQRRAALAYGAWAPELGSFAVGYHSVYTQYFAGGPLVAAANHIVRVPA